MNISNILHSLWIVAAAFFMAGCNILDVYPCGPGIFAASCMLNRSPAAVFIATLIGMATVMSSDTLIRYGIIMLVTGLFMSMKIMLQYRNSRLVISSLSGLTAFLIDVTAVYVFGYDIGLPVCIFEGMLIFSLSMVYCYGIYTVTEDYMKLGTENAAAISVTLLAASALYGMPVDIAGDIVIAETFALFSIIFAAYKFGFGIGMAWTVICGLIMSYMTGDTAYLTDWLLISLSTYALQCLIHGGRYVFSFIYVCVYIGYGVAASDVLVDEMSMKALISAVFIFILLPPHMLVRIGNIVTVEAENGSSEWGRLVIDRMNNLASAFKRIEYTLSGNMNTGIGLNEIGELIEGFTNSLEQEVPIRKTITSKLIEELAAKGAGVKHIAMLKNKSDRYEIYINMKINHGRLMSAEAVRQIVEKETGLSLMLKSESRNIVSRNYDIICMQEKPSFKCVTAVRRISRYAGTVSGDNFYIGSIMDGCELIMISDGMGNGVAASHDSSILIDALEELIAAGFEQNMSIRIVNSYLSDKNRGEHFTTLDMLLIDLHTGLGKLYKQGAATTYIRRGGWIELIKSTSLPVGVIDGAVCEHCSKKFYDGDMIVMVSDGVLESMIVENKEDYMRELIETFDGDEPEELVDCIAGRIYAQSGNRLRDDATVVVCRLVKTC